MPTKFDEAFARVQKLVAIFESGKDRYLSSDYQEAEVRKDFIDKFFTALGWDVNHDDQTNPYAQEVKVERGVNEGSSRKRADYAFHLAPNYRDVRFYVEAKRPSKDFSSADNYHQAIRYGWFTKRTSPFAVLTSFEDFHILDCRLKPNINDTLSRVVERFCYTDYVDPEKFARIYWLFSREAVAGGSLEKFAESHPVSKAKRFQRGLFKGGDTSPDEDFLEELDGYRQQLAQAFKHANPDLDGETLTEVTQRTLDRLVFTRFLEDKGIEAPVIENFGKQDGFWEDFINASLRLDRKYNGVVFKFHPRLDVKGFKPDEKVFARICEELTDETSPYNFNVIPIHILGSIYERFLGKVISDGARVVEKPEVRKAGGVYYTPEYIVRYIVENTVGKMIEGRTPEEISKLKFADIACGSGSFLLGVYDVLLKYHAEYYSKNPGKVRKADCVRRDGTLHLSLQKKRDILTNNLFGVDIDRQAVEVAQLSLYLKLLEDETVGTTSEFQDEFHFTLLPSLDKNIVCGNSLIGPDIADGGVLTDEEEKKINPLDYAQRFPAIFRRRRGDESQTLREQSETPHVVSYKGGFGELREAAPGDIEHNYPGGMPLHGSYSKGKKSKAAPCLPESEYEGGFDAIVGNPPYVRPHNLESSIKEYFWQHYKTFTHKSDLYCCFMENATRLLKPGGLFSYIVSHGWLRLNSFQELRRFVLDNYQIRELIEFPYNVFAEAQVATGVFVFEKSTTTAKNKLKVIRASELSNGATFQLVREIPQQVFQQTFQNVFDISISPETESIKDKMRHGILIGSNFEICFGLKTADDNKFLHHTKGLHKEDRPLLRGDDVKRYETNYKGEFVWYVPKRMRSNRPTARPGEPHRFEQPKVLVKDTSSDFACTYEPGEFYVKDVLIVIPKENVTPNYDLKFVTGVVNSKALHFYYRTTFQTIHVQNEELASLPLPKVDFTKPADKMRHDRLVELVEQMLAARAKLPSANTERDREFYTNKCATLDQEIDRLVYQLYGLTDEEIKLVEGHA
jgi:type I restriction-modification system DNA methylase subunit